MTKEQFRAAIASIEEDIAKLESKTKAAHKRIEKLCEQYKNEHAPIQAGLFAKAVWLRNGRKYKGVVFVTANHVVQDDNGEYKIVPTLIKCEPYADRCDDGTCKHYYTDYWEKQRKFVAYDELLSIEPYDAPRQTCGRCIWMYGIVKDGELRVGCSINIGYKCDGGNAYACDRFSWWNWEQSMGITHIEHIKRSAANGKKEYIK